MTRQTERIEKLLNELGIKLVHLPDTAEHSIYQDCLKHISSITRTYLNESRLMDRDKSDHRDTEL